MPNKESKKVSEKTVLPKQATLAECNRKNWEQKPEKKADKK